MARANYGNAAITRVAGQPMAAMQSMLDNADVHLHGGGQPMNARPVDASCRMHDSRPGSALKRSNALISKLHIGHTVGSTVARAGKTNFACMRVLGA